MITISKSLEGSPCKFNGKEGTIVDIIMPGETKKCISPKEGYCLVGMDLKNPYIPGNLSNVLEIVTALIFSLKIDKKGQYRGREFKILKGETK